MRGALPHVCVVHACTALLLMLTPFVAYVAHSSPALPVFSGRLRLPKPEGAEGAAGEGAAPAKKRGRLAAYESVDPVPVPTSLPFKRSTVKDTSKRRPWKALKKIIEGEAYERLPIDVPTYTGIEAPPSLLPAKKYCDLTGLDAKYTDPKTRLRYFSGHEYLQVPCFLLYYLACCRPPSHLCRLPVSFSFSHLSWLPLCAFSLARPPHGAAF